MVAFRPGCRFISTTASIWKLHSPNVEQALSTRGWSKTASLNDPGIPLELCYISRCSMAPDARASRGQEPALRASRRPPSSIPYPPDRRVWV